MQWVSVKTPSSFLHCFAPAGRGCWRQSAGWKDRDDDREMPVGYPGRDDAHPLCGAIRSDVTQSKPRGPS